MNAIAGLPYVPVRFDKRGGLVAPEPASLASAAVTDLIVISHGWHQDPDDAQTMYGDLLRRFRQEGGDALGRRFGVAGVYWPSDRFRDDLSREVIAALPGSAGAQAARAGEDASLEKLRTRASELATLFGVDPARFASTVARAAQGSSGDQDDLLRILRTAIVPEGEVLDGDLIDEHGPLLDRSEDGREVVRKLTTGGAIQDAAVGEGGAAQALGDGEDEAQALGLFGGPVAVIARILNQAAYFELKKRAGKVGARLGERLDADPLAGVERVHLVGHSFGARLVTAAAAAMRGRKPYSLTLLQGAFSHNAFGSNPDGRINGFFRDVVEREKVSERIVITHTWNDHAVGLMYAIASRASGDIATGGLFKVTDTFGGAKDEHGGMGANGAQLLAANVLERRVIDGAVKPLLSKRLTNLKCDFIKSHSDIRTSEVARVLVAAVE